MDLTHYFHLFRRWLWLLATCPILAGAVAAGVSVSLPKVYESNVEVLVRPAQPLAVDQGAAALTSDQIANTYAQLMLEPPLLNQVISELGLKTNYTQLSKQITVTPKPDTTILDVAVQDTDATIAHDIAARLVDDFITQIKQIQKQESATPNTRSQDNLIIVSPATQPTQPVSPSVTRNTLIAIFGGLMVAVGLVALLDYLDQSVKTDRDLLEKAGVPAMAHIPFSPASRGKRGEILTLAVTQPAAEAYRKLRTNVLFSGIDRQLQTIVVTSSIPGEGKSRTVANLAVVLAQAGHKTLIIDADLRRPSQHRLFGRVANVGMTNMILEEVPEADLLTPIEGIPNLWLLSSGTRPHNPSELLSSGRMKELLARFQQAFGYVVIDTPPINAVTDALILASGADATILVVEQNRTTIPDLRHAVHSLQQVGANFAGVVLNKLKAGSEEYHYSYRYDAAGEEPAAVPVNRPASSTRPSPAARAPEPSSAGR